MWAKFNLMTWFTLFNHQLIIINNYFIDNQQADYLNFPISYMRFLFKGQTFVCQTLPFLQFPSFLTLNQIFLTRQLANWSTYLIFLPVLAGCDKPAQPHKSIAFLELISNAFKASKNEFKPIEFLLFHHALSKVALIVFDKCSSQVRHLYSLRSDHRFSFQF